MEEFVIVGAGPVGLACAIFLNKMGKSFRIIEKETECSKLSKALMVNCRSLEIFDEFGMKDELLSRGYPLQKITLAFDEKNVLIDTALLPQDSNQVLVIPQFETEQFLREQLEKAGVEIERGVELFEHTDLGGSFRLRLNANDRLEEVETKYLLGADGMHSTVRKEADISFSGKKYPLKIFALDVEIESSLKKEDLLFWLKPNGIFAMLVWLKGNVYRIISNVAETETILPEGVTLGKRLWESSFQIHCRLANTFQKGNLYLMGDAAHVHSPVGGRGMNLGVEDAYIFTKFLKDGTLNKYDRTRRKASTRVLSETDKATKLLVGRSSFMKVLKFHILPLILKNKALQKKVLVRNMGLG